MLSRIIIYCVLVFSLSVSAQMEGASAQFKRKLINIEITKTGPYFGLQRGKYTVVEIGIERQWKKIRLRKPIIHAAHAGFNYNFKYNMLGYDMGYWYKPNRIGLTYGANLFFRTNFNDTRAGIAPVVGFKFALLHLQTGYHFMPRLPDNFETNRFFVSLRIGIINDRDVDFNFRKKGKKKR
ncbi:MAG: hypothetical protein ACI865_002784 [Flavobacteriaceae bacterium]|jgi:hypothetical protein